VQCRPDGAWLLAHIHCLTLGFVHEAHSGSCHAYLLNKIRSKVVFGKFGMRRAAMSKDFHRKYELNKCRGVQMDALNAIVAFVLLKPNC